MIPEMVLADPLAHNVWDKLTNEVLDATKGWILNDIVMYPLLYLILCLFYQKSDLSWRELSMRLKILLTP